MPAFSAAAAKPCAIALPGCYGRQHIDPGMAGKGLGDGHAFRRGERIGAAAAKCKKFAACHARRLGQEARAVLPQRLVRLIGAIPFEQREFRMMQGPTFAVAEHAG